MTAKKSKEKKSQKPDLVEDIGGKAEDRIQKLEEELSKEKESYLRLRAEFDNFRKRNAQDKEEFVKFAANNFILEILPILDSFERAQKAFENHKDEVEEIKKGTALIHKQFEDVLKKLGVKKVESVGKPFDPNLHEAVMQQEAAEKEPNTILEEIQPGYMMHDKVIRPAMVIVSKK